MLHNYARKNNLLLPEGGDEPQAQPKESADEPDNDGERNGVSENPDRLRLIEKKRTQTVTKSKGQANCNYLKQFLPNTKS